MKRLHPWEVTVPFVAAVLWFGIELIIGIPIIKAVTSPLFLLPLLLGVIFLISYIVRRPPQC